MLSGIEGIVVMPFDKRWRRDAFSCGNRELDS